MSELSGSRIAFIRISSVWHLGPSTLENPTKRGGLVLGADWGHVLFIMQIGYKHSRTIEHRFTLFFPFDTVNPSAILLLMSSRNAPAPAKGLCSPSWRYRFGISAISAPSCSIPFASIRVHSRFRTNPDKNPPPPPDDAENQSLPSGHFSSGRIMRACQSYSDFFRPIFFRSLRSLRCLLFKNPPSVTGPANSVSLLLRVTPFKIINVYGPCYTCYGCYGFLERGILPHPDATRNLNPAWATTDY